jgi:hypothetical protein
LLGLFFDLEDEGEILLRNTGWISTDCLALFARRQKSSTYTGSTKMCIPTPLLRSRLSLQERWERGALLNFLNYRCVYTHFWQARRDLVRVHTENVRNCCYNQGNIARPHYSQTLALTSPKSSGHSVGIFRWQTQTTELVS